MYEILEDEKNQSKRRNYRIYKDPEKVYDEYFCHGIEGRDELLEGIIFFSHIREKREHCENKLEDLVNRSTDIYLQFYRFVDLNDRDKVPNYYHLEKERDLKVNIKMQIRNKIEQLRMSNDDYMFISNQERRENPQRYDEDERKRDERIRRKKEEEQVKINSEMKNKEVTRIYAVRIEKEIEKRVERRRNEIYNDDKRGNVYREEKENVYREIYSRIYEEERKKYFNEKKITIKDNEIIYSARERLRYAHFPEDANPDNMRQFVIRHWTENVYDILTYLNDLEKIDKTEYYRIWLHTRIERLKNRGYIDDGVKKEIGALKEIESKVVNLQQKRKKNKEEIGQDDEQR